MRGTRKKKGGKPIQRKRCNTNIVQDKTIDAVQNISPDIGKKQITEICNEINIQIISKATVPIGSNDYEITRILLNLLPRQYRKISYFGDQRVLDTYPPSHRKRIIVLDEPDEADISIIVGNGIIPSGENLLFVGSCGWSSYISWERACPYDDNDNPIGALFCGAFAVGEVFLYAFSDHIAGFCRETKEYDPLTHGSAIQPVITPKIPEEITFDEILIVGMGGVGFGIIYSLSLLPKIIGKMVVIDHEQTDESNEQRYLSSYKENRGMLKVHIAQGEMMNRQKFLAFGAFFGQYESYRNVISDSWNGFPMVVVTVDNENTRKNIQASLSRTILNGWTDTTGDNFSYGIGRHELGNDYECLACSYFPDEHPKTQDELYSLRTGFPVEEIIRRRMDRISTTEKEIEKICKDKGIPPEKLLPLAGKPLDEVLHAQCGLFHIGIPDKKAATPVPHIPLLTALHLTTQLLIPHLEMNQDIKPITSAGIFYGNRWPGIDNLELRKKAPDCICSDPDYIDSYNQLWN